MRLALSLAFASFLALHTHTAQAIETTMDIDWSATGVTPVQNARMGQSVADDFIAFITRPIHNPGGTPGV